MTEPKSRFFRGTTRLSGLLLTLSAVACSARETSPTGWQQSTGGVGPSGAGGQAVGGGLVLPFAGAPSNSGGSSGASNGCAEPESCRLGCGNGRVEPTLSETCDDGNGRAGDGCSAVCTLEKNFACPEPGKPCANLVQCGDGKVAGPETCDDGNTISGDGCSASCALELGYDCPTRGAPCSPRCGDGLLRGAEECEAPNVGHGCSALCRLEEGFVCDAPRAKEPASCRATRCGDSLREGSEVCDDGNDIDGDGCSSSCTLEPDCSSGACVSRCGDHIKIAPEECDDGNTADGDGCDQDCRVESGFSCNDSTAGAPRALNLFVTYRDFISFPVSPATRHPDFESAFAADDRSPGLVKSELGSDGRPEFDGRCSSEQPTTIADRAVCPYGQVLTTKANFGSWYRTTAGVNVALDGVLALKRVADGSYVYDSAPQGFYPIDARGFLAAPARELTATADATVNDGKEHNFGFSTEIHYFFQYRGGESLSFSGDDDLWIFINRRLALDVGGLHPRTELTLNLDSVATSIGLSRGRLYEIALFHAERHSAGSNFKLTLTGFVPSHSLCAPICGDGVVVPPERCDDGRAMNTGKYGGCRADCERGPFCGDGVLQVGDEACDDGTNLTTYGVAGAPGCAPGCVLSGYCGDGKLDALFGEQCDRGAAENQGGYNGCGKDCQLAARCGDGILQASFGEVCDDGNTVSGDGCGYDCKPDVR